MNANGLHVLATAAVAQTVADPVVQTVADPVVQTVADSVVPHPFGLQLVDDDEDDEDDHGSKDYYADNGDYGNYRDEVDEDYGDEEIDPLADAVDPAADAVGQAAPNAVDPAADAVGQAAPNAVDPVANPVGQAAANAEQTVKAKLDGLSKKMSKKKTAHTAKAHKLFYELFVHLAAENPDENLIKVPKSFVTWMKLTVSGSFKTHADILSGIRREVRGRENQPADENILNLLRDLKNQIEAPPPPDVMLDKGTLIETFKQMMAAEFPPPNTALAPNANFEARCKHAFDQLFERIETPDYSYFEPHIGFAQHHLLKSYAPLFLPNEQGDMVDLSTRKLVILACVRQIVENREPTWAAFTKWVSVIKDARSVGIPMGLASYLMYQSLIQFLLKNPAV